MIRVYGGAGAVYIDGYRTALIAGTLAATATGDTLSIATIGSSEPLAAGTYTAFGRQDSSVFASLAEAMAYLTSVLATPAPVGDQAALPVLIAQVGQTVIPLQQPPSSLASVRLVVNGAEYRAPDIAVSATAVTWTNPDFQLEPSDRVSVVYA